MYLVCRLLLEKKKYNIIYFFILLLHILLIFKLFPTRRSSDLFLGKMLKAYFNKETLQEIYMSLNNIDRLRYLVAKTYKNLYPFGQHILGVFQSEYSKIGRAHV